MKQPVFTNNSIHTEFNPTEEKNEKLKLNKKKFSCGFNKILDIELEVIKQNFLKQTKTRHTFFGNEKQQTVKY